jgi:predicted ArsR family transcriptional regulator
LTYFGTRNFCYVFPRLKNMKAGPRKRHFWSGRRARIFYHLQNGAVTVNDLAGKLGLTDNAVRAHLRSLEDERLIRRCGVRKGSRRPHVAYELTSKAEQLFSTPYDRAFTQLIGVLKSRMTPRAVREVFRVTGKSLASANSGVNKRRNKVADRVRAAVKVLRACGGNVRTERANGSLLLRSAACPLAAVVAQHPETCQILESLLAQIIGRPIRQCCVHGMKPRCGFEIKIRQPSPKSPKGPLR